VDTAIVTGGAGFLGSHLCKRLLDDGYEVICVDNLKTGAHRNIEPLLTHEHFRFVDHDVIDGLPEDLSAQAVFHLASPASPNHHSKISYHALPMETMLVNTQGTMKILEFCEKQQAKFLFTSTSEVYGNPLEHPQKETYNGNVSTTGPRSVYDEAKRFGETITAYFSRTGRVDARIARLFNTYGPNMNTEDMRMVIIFITQALRNEPITIYGEGKQTRSLCYVDDTIDGLVKLMFTQGTNGEVVNIGSEDEHTVFDYAGMIKKLTDSESEIIFAEALPQDDPMRRRADITKARELLGWEPKVGLEEGLTKIIRYFREAEEKSA
jgi:nucleoside-diphosphate-sugar epimerase